MSNIEITQTADGKISVLSPYNADFPADAKRLGGRWSGQRWVFPGHAAAEVRALVIEHYGTDGQTDVELVTIEVRIKGWAINDTSFPIAGIPIARVFDRDGGAKLGEGVVVVSGGFSSGGSKRYPNVTWSEGTVVRLQVPEGRIAAIRDDRDVSEVRIIDNVSVQRERLEQERERLTLRLDAIEAELAELGQ